MEFTAEHLPAAALALGPALANLALLVYVATRPRKNGTLYALAGLLVSLCVWQFSDALVRLSATAEDARTWMDLLAFGSLLIGPLGMHFALLYTGRHRLAQSVPMLVFLYTPPLVFEMASRARFAPSEVVDAGFWAWGSSVPTDGLRVLLGLWVSGLAVATVVVLGRHARSTPAHAPTGRPAFLLALGFGLPVVQGTITQVILPTAFGVSPLPIASTVMLVFSAATLVAIRRYDLLEAPSMGERLSATERKLEREHRLLSEAERLAHLGSWEWDVATGRVQWTDEMYRIYGHEPRAFLVDFDRAVEQMFPEDREKSNRDLQRSFTKAREEFRRSGTTDFGTPGLEYRIRRPDGEVRWLRGEGTIHLDAAGKPARLTGTVRDFTRDRLFEQEQTANVAREAQIQRLKDVDEFKSRFINTAAHELNTPLTPIRLQLHLLKNIYLAESKDPLTKQSMEILDRNVLRLSQLIQDVLDSTRVQSDRLAIHRRPTDLNQLVKEAVDSFHEPALHAGVNLEFVLAPVAPVDGDPLRLSQVLYNLLSNAVKFTPAGGRVTIETFSGPTLVGLRVSDTGMGIADEDLKRLFQPFVQVNLSPEANIPGTGLGLYITRGITEAHGGRIWCESEGRGKGTTFHVEFPAASKPSGPRITLESKPGARHQEQLEERIRRLL